MSELDVYVMFCAYVYVVYCQDVTSLGSACLSRWADLCVSELDVYVMFYAYVYVVYCQDVTFLAVHVCRDGSSLGRPLCMIIFVHAYIPPFNCILKAFHRFYESRRRIFNDR